MSSRCVVGVDLGGTNVRAQAIDQAGRAMGERVEIPSRAQAGVEETVAATAEAIRAAVGNAAGPVEAVGVAVPGFIDAGEGVVRWAPNFGKAHEGVFHYWTDVPFGRLLHEILGLPVTLGNDANCAALGEYSYGSGKGEANCLVLVTVGTGIGGGVVLGRRATQGGVGPALLLGGNQGGAELGHIVIRQNGLDCNSGAYGSLEAYCQRDAIVRRAQHRLRRGRTSLVREMVADIADVTPRHLAEAAHKGDEMALEVWSEVGAALGAGLGSLINIFAPDVLAVGGQIGKVGAPLLLPAIAEARNTAIPALFADCRILTAEQIDDAGLLGAAALALAALPQ
ncbi:MAG: ROK family protein [Fimbriimonadaceae bacterium]|nr:ROK family protein [Fimbriimonadaceae bacterium]QYK55395.1 MAG: ROK family protein [Fimbriimonadaceae bacterium]